MTDQKLFLVRGTTTGEYEIVRGIHPFQSERVYHSIVFHAIGPASPDGYSVVVEDNIPQYVFEAAEALEAEVFSINNSRRKLVSLAKKQGLEYIDTTLSQVPARISSRNLLRDVQRFRALNDSIHPDKKD